MLSTRRHDRSGVGRLGVLTGAFLLACFAGCSDDCCTVDSFPILLERAPSGAPSGPGGGGLLALGRSGSINGGASFSMSVDTGAALTVFDGSADGVLETMPRSLEILDASAATPRARFAGLSTLALPLGNVGDAAHHPLAILGADLLRGYSIELQLDRPSITFWDNQRADDGFLADAGYAVVHFTPFGGGQLTAQGDPDLFGLQGPLEIPATRIVFRTCAAPPPFDPSVASTDVCCTRNDALMLSRGTELALVMATGVGPLVLGRAAWQRTLPSLAQLGVTPATTSAPLWIATAGGGATQPITADWTTLPRLALVNQESNANDDAGPCVDLARSRRLERVSFAQAGGVTGSAVCTPLGESLCVQPCDTDPQETDKAQNSAAYIELGGDLAVAIIADDEPMLQGLRADVRSEGPEVDGIIGAGALQGTRVELDYRSSSPRAIFSCAGTPARDACWTGARCPRLPDGDTCHACFNLGPSALPKTCVDSGCR